MSSELGFVSASAILQYIRLGRELQLDWEGAVAVAGLPLEELENGQGRFTGEQFQTFLLSLIASSGDPLLGLKSAEFVQPGSYNVLGYIVMSCARVADALERIVPYEKLVGDMGVTRIVDEGDLTRVEWHCAYPHPQVRPHMIANVLASWVNYCRWLANREDLPPVEIRFEFALPTGCSPSDFEKVFRCPVRFGAPHSAVLLSEPLLQISLRQPDETLRQTLEAHARNRLASLQESHQALTIEVRNRIRRALGAGLVPRQDSIADELGITGRTLQRRLGEEDSTYQQLLDDVRLEQARQALASGDEAIADIAERLGYAEPRSFHRWFKQVTGQTPGEFRLDFREVKHCGQ